jgi:hypothetical protein
LLFKGARTKKRGSAALRRRPGPVAIGFEPLFIAGRLLIEGAGAAPGRESCRFPAPLQSPASSNSYRLSGGIDAGYAVAIGLVALATLARWTMGDYVGGEIPFITFFPAIIIVTLIGGLQASAPSSCRCSRHGICSFHLLLVSS